MIINYLSQAAICQLCQLMSCHLSDLICQPSVHLFLLFCCFFSDISQILKTASNRRCSVAHPKLCSTSTKISKWNVVIDVKTGFVQALLSLISLRRDKPLRLCFVRSANLNFSRQNQPHDLVVQFGRFPTIFERASSFHVM